MSNNTTVKVDSELKAEYENLFEELHGVQPKTSTFLNKELREEIEELKKELKKKKK